MTITKNGAFPLSTTGRITLGPYRKRPGANVQRLARGFPRRGASDKDLTYSVKLIPIPDGIGKRYATTRYLSSGPTASTSPRYFGAATMGSMALIVFFRGINVGGHRAFRPSVLAKELGIYDAVNVGAAGTLVIRKPGLRAKFLAELRRKLPFEATIAFCDGSDLIRLEMDNPFGTEPPRADVVQFVSILSEAGRRRVSLPIALPEGGEWLVRIIGSKNRLVYGVYRRHMKTIGYLGQIDRLFGAPATTRSWNTILSVLRILKSHEPGK